MAEIHERVDSKLRRVHQALGVVRTRDMSAIPWEQERDGPNMRVGFDFTKNQNQAEIENALWQLIANIASIKDHLKTWSTHHNVSFEGDKLIDSNRDVAIVHDLWNRDKHAELNRSRSGAWPELRHIGRGLLLRPAAGEKSATVSINLNSMRLEFSGNNLVGIDAVVIDKNGKKLGSALDFAEKALDAWLVTLVQAGVPIPSQ